MEKFGGVLRALSVFWCVGAILRMLVAANGYRSGSIKVHFLLLLLGVATFALGSWLRNRKKTKAAAKRIAAVKSKWWQSDYGFRLSVFMGTSWAIGAFLWQDSYDRDYSVMFGPAAAILALHAGYKYFVVGSMTPEFPYELVKDEDVEVDEGIQSLTKREPLEETLVATSEGREKSMDELIRLMNKTTETSKQ